MSPPIPPPKLTNLEIRSLLDRLQIESSADRLAALQTMATSTVPSDAIELADQLSILLESDMETRLTRSKTDPRKLFGEYIMHMNYSEYGELTQRQMDGHKVVFEWSDSSGVGLLEMIFNDTFTEFEGVYGKGLSWSGIRCH